MTITKEIIRSLFAEAQRLGAEDHSGYVGDRVQAIQDIARKSLDLARLEAAEERRHREETDRLRVRRSEIIRECPHPGRRHNPDPSGGSDSFYSCDICGHQW